MMRVVYILFFCLWILGNISKAEEPEKVLRLLIENKEIIKSTGILFNVPSRLIASIIYTERTLNVNWMENQLDLLLAKSGYSSSIGLGQVKIHTAEWIEKKIHDEKSKYFLGVKHKTYISRSKNRDEIIERLEEIKWNVKYITAYIAMFCHRWKNEGYDISKKPEIVGTLYSLGPYKVLDGSERKPHKNPQSNNFGEETAKFFYSTIIRDIFP